MKRLKEASTWAGLAAILQALKVLLPNYALALDGATVVAGTIATVVPDKGAAAPAESGQ